MTTSTSELNADQINQYFTRIELPIKFHNVSPNLELLTTLHVHHISSIPYENAALHYTTKPHISLAIPDLYHKFVERSRGGYCMENNIFFHHVLRFLGFQVYLTGARLYRESTSSLPGWSGWEHSVNIITIDGIKYLSDVGYGGDGPGMPMPLIKQSTIIHNIGTQEIRLLHGSMPGLVEGHEDLWTFQFRNSVEKPWRCGYGFYELEFFQRDFEISSFYCSQNPACFLTFNLLVMRFLRDEGKVYGKVILEQNKLKENLGGKSVLVQTCQTEAERQKVLSDRFGIVLTAEERSGIVGRSTALTG
ncbi:arylamine N-acetyltransferase 1 [Penicillium citrinum]|uniref:Arylamine N-acetyltransferase 1 n=1 Tax=Penicillium citrinum TaxID=5077 RepID=A0A9W9TWS1_PENCI|nr:arylamine N-acetyltransferase 1 [Penicillium citrinum]KAJ5242305.1 arylamine N-acetyltransferase 1 [Penicillium citrinum]